MGEETFYELLTVDAKMIALVLIVRNRDDRISRADYFNHFEGLGFDRLKNIKV